MTSHNTFATRQLFFNKCKKQKGLIIAAAFFSAYILVFSYVPIWGWLMAFQEYKPARGISGSEWVAFRQFYLLFSDSNFLLVLRNTLAMSFINITLSFTSAITLAILLNEIRTIIVKRMIQTISYLPHFVSWVVAANLVLTTLSLDGALNNLLMFFGIINEPILWMGNPNFFWLIIGFSNVWKSVGWNAIIYLAVIASIDPALYEAAGIDGAGRMQRIFRITLPNLVPIIRLLLIMQCGWILSTSFEQVLLMQNPMVISVSDVLDTYTLRYGIFMSRFSYGTAAGIFQSVVSIVMLVSANYLSKRISGEGII